MVTIRVPAKDVGRMAEVAYALKQFLSLTDRVSVKLTDDEWIIEW